MAAVTQRLTRVSSRLKWSRLCQLLENIKNERKKAVKKNLLMNFMDSYREQLAALRRVQPTSEESFLPVMRMLVPALDRDRVYGLKEKRLADTYIKLFEISKDSPDALKLTQFRKPKIAGGNVGDFAEVAYYVLKNRCPVNGLVELQQVDDVLEQISQKHAANDSSGVNALLMQAVRQLTAGEMKWFIRVLLKDMQLGIGETTIISAWHPDAKEYFDVTNRLDKVCSVLRDPSVRLSEIEISLFSAFHPMLAERSKLHGIEKQMKNKTYLAEIKFDGERSLLHKKGDQFMYFSRNGLDFTSSFGGSPATGSLTPHLHHLFSKHVKDAIMDGEVVCWHKHLGMIIKNGEHYDVKKLKEDGPVQVCFCAFDLLLLNGRVLTGRPLAERYSLLTEALKEAHGRVIISKHSLVSSKDDVIRELNLAIDRREEGLVLKDPDSVYRPNGRVGDGWIKLKPDYVDNLVNDLDLLIVGGFYGAGRLHGTVNQFLLAVADSNSISDGGRVTRLVTVCKVGSGCSDQELTDLSQRLVSAVVKKRPSLVAECSRDKPDVWFEPSQSVVLQVRAAEMATTKAFGTPYTLRFPRVDKIRSDKLWHDITTTAELQQLYERGLGKLALHHYREVTEGSASTSGSARSTKINSRIELPSHFKAADLTNVKQTSRLLSGLELCVLSKGSGLSKQQLEQCIAEAGGRVTQHPGAETFCLICDTMNVRCRNLAASHSIIKSSWLLRSLAAKRLLHWGPLDALSLLPEDQVRARATHDEYGDSYESDIDIDRLDEVLTAMPEEDVEPELVEELMLELEENDMPFNLFRGVTAVFVDRHGNPTTVEVERLRLELHGGRVVEQLQPDVTHLISCCDESALSIIEDGRKLVTLAWVSEAIERKARAEESLYLPTLTVS